MKNWKRIGLWILILAFVAAGITAPQVGRAGAAQHAQALLIQMATAQPDALLSIIVQKAVKDGSVEATVKRLGGTVTKDLNIIAAFAAEVPGRAVLSLSQLPEVRWMSLDSPVVKTVSTSATTSPSNYFLDTLGVRSVWSMGYKGTGIGVAIIDSGVSLDNDFRIINSTKNRLVKQVGFNLNSRTVNDVFGHGTHVAGIIGGAGQDSNGTYMGIAPDVNLFSLKVSDDTGMASESDVVAALQWVYDSRASYNIRVVNLSLNSTLEQSYNTSPMDAAAEVLWFDGVVVITSAGNKGTVGSYNTANASPANDPFVITVGASDEKGTTSPTDDAIAAYSAYGTTSDGIVKPDILAPGTSIYSVLSKNSPWCTQYPVRAVLSCSYFRLSGTSMAAPMVAGTVALMLQKEPALTPDQVKYRLTHAINQRLGTYPYLNTYKALTTATTQSSNTGLAASQLLWSGSTPVTWNSVNWNSVNWNSVNWNSVNWNSVNWNSVNWNSMYWGQ